MTPNRLPAVKTVAILLGLLSLAFFAPGPVPTPWVDADIGGPGQVGSATYDPANGNWVLKGGGGDIWGGADQFNFASMPVTGDCVITAHVVSLTDGAGGATMDQWSKVGVMIRDGTGAGAMDAYEVFTGNNGTAYQYRLTTGAGAATQGQTGGGAPHLWLRMIRTGTSFQGAYSDDGITWTNQGTPQTIAMPASALVGLACTAHNNATLSIATFDNVKVTDSTGSLYWPLTPPTNLTATPGFNSATLNWNAVTGAASYSIYRAGAPGGPYGPTPLATVTAPTTTYLDTGLVYPNTYYYVVTATAAVGTTVYSNEASCTPLQPPISVDATTIQTLEAGAPVTFHILINQPLTGANSITFTITSNSGTEGQVSSSGQPPAPATSAPSISFLVSGPQIAGTSIPVTVYGMDDSVVDGPQPYTVTVAFTSTQAAPFSGFTIPVINCTNNDNDTPGITISRTSGLLTTEDGTSDFFTVVLNTQPTANVTMTLASTNLLEGIVSPTSLTFTTVGGAAYSTSTGIGGWNVGHVVLVTGVDDTLLDFTIPYTITTGALSSSDPSYNGMAVSDVAVDNLDNEVPPALPAVWGNGGCGLLGLEVALPLLLALARRRRNT